MNKKRKWATASDALLGDNNKRKMIRLIEDDKRPLACSYLADLVDMHFREDLGNEKARREWLLAHREMQRQLYRSRGDLAHFEPREIDKFLSYKTHFAIRELRRIKRLPLTSLVKWHNGQPLSGDYHYAYSLCSYPASKVRIQE